MVVCEMTKDQTEASSFGPIWSLTIEPLWYELTVDTQVPLFTYISYIFDPIDGSRCVQWALMLLHLVNGVAPVRKKVRMGNKNCFRVA